MFCPHKNSYLQLVVAMNPRVINKAVDQAMNYRYDPHANCPAIQRMDSMQPSLYAPHVDITRARRGFERTGLKLLIRDLHSDDALVQLQALHSIMDRVQIAEDAMFLIDNKVVFRITELLRFRNPVVREKVCLTLTHLANYQQGRDQMTKINNLFHDIMWLWIRDKKEIRYAAAYTLQTLSRDLCVSQEILKTQGLVENLLKMVTKEHGGIVVLHLKSLENLLYWEQEEALKCNAFQVFLALFVQENHRIVCGAMDCMAQLLNHDIGKKLADQHDLTFRLRPYLKSMKKETVVSAASLMKMTTLTVRSKWRAKECCSELTKRLASLSYSSNLPILQLSCMQVLINLCDCPDIRYYVKQHLEKTIMSIPIRTHENWDGTSETTSYGLETGYNYRTMCIEGLETIKNDYGDNALVANVHSYLDTLYDMKRRLIIAINWKPYT